VTSLTALTLHSDRKTASRRHPPIPQLTCEGKLCRQYQPDVVQCVKVGEDGVGGLEWKCEAELPRGMRFGEIEVGCEGWGEYSLFPRRLLIVICRELMRLR